MGIPSQLAEPVGGAGHDACHRGRIGENGGVESPGGFCPQCLANAEYVGAEADAFALECLVSFDLRPGPVGELGYDCPRCGARWVIDHPNRHAPYRADVPRLRRLPLPPDAPPVGAVFW